MRRQRVQSEMEQAHRRRKEFLWWTLILIVAATLRFWGLGDKSLWLDEIMSVQKASVPFPEMMKLIRRDDAHPPLFQTVEWLWLRTGTGDAWARVPSAMAGVVGVWLAMRIARRLFGRRAAYAAGVLMALSAFHVFYSQEARLQSLVTTLVLAQCYLLLLLADNRRRETVPLWIAYGVLSLATLYTYALAILPLGGMALLYLWLTRRRRTHWRRWIALHAVVGLLFLPWAPVMQARAATLAESLRIRGDAAGRPTFAQLADGAAAWATGMASLGEGTPRVLLGAVLPLAALAVALARRGKRPAKCFAALFILPLVAYLLMPMPRAHTYDPKHLIFLQPFLLITLAGIRSSVQHVGARRRRMLPAMPAALMVLVLAAPNVLSLSDYYGRSYEKENWRALCSEVVPALKPGDLIVFDPSYVGFAFDYYSEVPPNMKLAGFLLPRLWPTLPRPQRIWLVEGRSPVELSEVAVPAFLAQAGWRELESKSYPGAIGTVRWRLFAH